MEPIRPGCGRRGRRWGSETEGANRDALRVPRALCERGHANDTRAWRSCCDARRVSLDTFGPPDHPVYVSVSAKDIYGGQRPQDVPAYSIREAAGLVGISPSTLRSWVRGRSFPKRGGVGRSPAIIAPPSVDDGAFLSFTNVVEAHVLSGLRRKYELKLDAIRAAVRYVHDRLHVEHPLAMERFKTDGASLFVERFGRTINASKEGQVAMREVLEAYLERIEYDDGRAIRLFPLLRDAAPRVIVVDPRLSFGRPTIAGTSVPVVAVRGRFDAGDSVESLAHDFDVRPDQIEEALRAAQAA